MPRVAASECSDNRSAQSREGLPPESGKDTDVCRWRPTRADPLLSLSPYWWRRHRQTHLLPIGIATASPSGRFRYERNRRPRPLVPRVPCGWKKKVSKRHRLTQPLLTGDWPRIGDFQPIWLGGEHHKALIFRHAGCEDPVYV